ncbi:phage baseplate assembly protein [Acinetobacter ursingii]|uniref:phage baseplate assembly protein domain-containing protein n=1 Tax=Acinetobacter ursingii TaxID=108980 RepID=UPI002449659F|nr:phage baseplate assembly protein [Acinetobacter ursingii]MDH2019008.1 phage baseplate assembly protein [Acinetobacter ursingii]MDH2071456.1 phage baseplate assembly protein [Acinetobacter ursingii]
MMHAISQQVKKGLGQIRQVFQGIVARGGSDVLQLTGYADETLQEVELFQQVGFSSHIPEGSRVIVIPLQGKTAKSIVVATTAGTIQINVESGETCVYDQFGHSVWLKQDGTHVAGDLFVDGNISSTGDVSDQKSSMQDMRDIYNGHKHGNTSVPNEQM